MLGDGCHAALDWRAPPIFHLNGGAAASVLT